MRPRTKQVSKPYFREWTNMRFSKGKSFLSNPQLFRQHKALYFPNLQGVTLASPKVAEDTTPVLQGKISIVSVFCSQWAERQVATFVSKDQNPALHEALGEINGPVQLVDINIEENPMKVSLIRLFMPLLRRRIPEDRHGKYFVIRKGMTEDIRNVTGLLNGYVGYVYLLDNECKIRWAGSGIATVDERQGLARGVRRLLASQKEGNTSTTHSEQVSLEKEAEAAAAAAA
ncbi:MAG: Mitochondrial ATPase complex subunit atp10 [Candelina mexicana]|nr:MAG: Mitochondrial ATPase complex subunit atp10 [Candelina mexicana]